MGHPVLRQKTRPVEKHELKTRPMQRLIDDMFETMREYSGVGLAAPQVHASVRVFVAHLDNDGRGESEPIAIVNPEIEVVGDTVDRGLGRLPEHSRHSRARAAGARDQAHCTRPHTAVASRSRPRSFPPG